MIGTTAGPDWGIFAACDCPNHHSHTSCQGCPRCYDPLIPPLLGVYARNMRIMQTAAPKPSDAAGPGITSATSPANAPDGTCHE